MIVLAIVYYVFSMGVHCELYLNTQIDRIITDGVNLIWTFKSTEHSICRVMPSRGSNPGPSALNASAHPIEITCLNVGILIIH